MIRANVGISRKFSQDFNSSGFSLNLEAEILATVDDPETLVERIKELYDLAEEALDRKVSEAREIETFANRDSEVQSGVRNNGRIRNQRPDDPDITPSRNGHHEEPRPNGDQATNKQVQFLTSLAKRQKLSGIKLEEFIEEVIGRNSSPYDLSKKEAGRVIDALNPEGAPAGRSRR